MIEPPSRVLLVTFGSITNPDGGLPARARSTADCLARLGLEVTVVCEEPVKQSDEVALQCKRVITLGSSWRLLGSKEAFDIVRSVSRGVDLVIVNSALLMPILTRACTGKALIWDTNECETLHYARMPPSLGRFLRKRAWTWLEAWSSRACTHAVAISQEESEWWVRLFPAIRNKLSVVNHRIMVEQRSEEAAAAYLSQLCSEQVPAPILLFVGNLAAKHNLRAARWIERSLVPRLPKSCSVVLAGRGTRAFDRPGSSPRVYGLGVVYDIDSVILASDLCLAPLDTGAGVKSKVLHYIAHGRPVIGTPAAFEGLRDPPGTYVAPIALMADLILSKLSNQDNRDWMADSQKQWLAEHHGSNVIRDQWASVLRQLSKTRNVV